MLMKATLRIILIICCLIFCGENVLACLCNPITPGKARKQADVVFVGTVVESYRELSVGGGFEWRVRLSVEQSWKEATGDDVVIYTSNSDCRARFETGRKYLVYAQREEGRGRLETSMCMRTRALEFGSEDLQKLGKGKYHGVKGS